MYDKHTFPDGSIVTGHHFHIADLARPSSGTQTLVRVVLLATLGAIHARFDGAPVHKLFAVFASIAVRTVARVVLEEVHTGSAIGTRSRIAFIDT